jgi:hypothetical protein
MAMKEKITPYQKAVEGVQRVAHMALVRVQTRNDDEA